MGLLTARDGVVGPWQGAVAPPVRPPAAPENLRAYPDWCRQVALSNEILSRLTYSFEPADGMAMVHLLDFSRPGQISSAPLVQLIAPDPEDFVVQTRIVHDYADLRPDRMGEISDQVEGTLDYFARLLPFDMARMPLTMNLLGLAQDCALHAAQHCKHLLACRRPDAFSAQIQPMIPTPGHSALPSGHATEAFTIAETLRRLVPGEFSAEGLDQKLMQMAARIAVNRTVAGVHFPADSFAGAMLGFAVADVIARRAGQPEDILPVLFDGRGIGHADFHMARVWRDGARQDFATDDGAEITRFGRDAIATDTSGLLRWLWSEAVQEWRR
ncbi:MAG: phosphatase PAP2 family protein [Pseudomonadota bacterium]